MSRIGKKAIEIPAGVTAKIDGNFVSINGPKGTLTKRFRSLVNIYQKENQLAVTIERENHFAKSLWGLSRTILANMVTGVTSGFEKKLEFHGVGFRAAVEKKEGNEVLVLTVGFSHPVEVVAPENINFKVEKNVITVLGIDKEVVGQVAARVRKIRPPEPYKGKGIKYLGEHIKRKVGKAVAKAGEGE